MPDLKTRFAKAQQEVNNLAARPDNETLLKLCAFHKRATEGDATGEGPGGFDFVRRAKFDAWSAVEGTTPEESMRRSIALAKSLQS